MNKALLPLGLSAGLIGLTVTVAAQDFTMDYAVLGGGGICSGGDFELAATVGHADAAGEMAGPDFAVSGGFWSLVTALETPGGPALDVTLAGPR